MRRLTVYHEKKDLLTKINQTIKKVTEDIERDFSFNTAIASLMELTNTLYAFSPETEREKVYLEKE